MAKKDFGLAVVGNALVDVLARADEAFVAQQARDRGMKRGAMNLITAERANELYGLMAQATEMSGGSGANSLSAFASFGGRGAFIGKVAQDQLGEVFRHDLKSMGVVFETQPIIVGAKTGRDGIHGATMASAGAKGLSMTFQSVRWRSRSLPMRPRSGINGRPFSAACKAA